MINTPQGAMRQNLQITLISQKVMVANDYSDDLNKTIGMEMLTAYASLGNQYVLNYFRAVKGI